MVDVYVSMMQDAYPLTTLLLIITSIIIAGLYMASKAIGSSKLESWIKNEVFQCFATALFLFIAAGIFSIASDLMGLFLMNVAGVNNLPDVQAYMQSNMQAGNLVDAHIIFARAYLLSRLDALNDMYDFLFYTYAVFGTMGGTGYFFPEQGTVNIGLGFLTTVANLIQPLLEYIYYGFLFVYMQLALLELIKAYFFYAFPAGIFLRAFPFTRSLGSFLIATSIGLYFVYPFFLSLMLFTHYEKLNLDSKKIIELIGNEYPSQYLVYYVQQKLLHEEVASPSKSSLSLSNVMGKISWISSAVQFLLLTMILYPLVAFVATYTFIHQFGTLMRANVSDLGRGLIKLI